MDQQALHQLQKMVEFEKQFDAKFAVDSATGEYLYKFVKEKQPRRILELGTWRGASAIYMASALKELGRGELITVDIGNDRVAQAKDNFLQAGISNYVTQVISDIHEYLPNDATNYDLVFMDASKKHQSKWLKQLLHQNLQKGSWIIIDDYLTMGDRMKAIRDFVESSINLKSTIKKIDDGLLIIEVLS